MKEFDDYDNLFNFLDESLDNSLENLAEIFRQTLFDFVNENFYNAYEPILYKRTWEVLNSISVSKKYKEEDITTVDVFFDTSKIHPKPSSFYVPPNLPRYNHHMDIHGNPTSDVIVYLMNDGEIIGHGKAHFFKDIDKWAKNKSNWILKLKSELNNKGIDIV